MSEKDIQEQFEYDVNYARKTILRDGHLLQKVVGVLEDGKLIVIPMAYENDFQKDVAFDTVRLCFLAFGVVRYTHLSEVWISRAAKTDPSGRFYEGVRPSQDPQREEAVLVCCVTRTGVRAKMLMIRRDSDEKITDLVDGEEMNGMKLSGRVMEFLPPDLVANVPAMRKQALKILQDNGVDVVPFHPDAVEGTGTMQ